MSDVPYKEQSVYARDQYNIRRTKDDLATIQYANQLVSWCLVMVDLEQFYDVRYQ